MVRPALVLDDIFLEHRAPLGHAESPDRARAIAVALRDGGAESIAKTIAPRPATEVELHGAHSAAYLEELAKIVPNQSGWLDEDTFFSPGSWNAALAAAGGAVDLALASLSGEHPRGLAVVRPPGHHAEHDRGMGFCLLNNVAVAARAARAAGAARVAIIDWDVHHGNGTQDIFWRDPDVLYVSTHQWPLYPGTGGPAEIGAGPGKGATINLPLPPGSGDREYAAAFEEVIVPRLLAYRPDLVLVSAGFDAYVDDPLASMRLSLDGYMKLCGVLREVADRVCGGRMVAVLEGGYDLAGLAACASGVFRSLATETCSRLTFRCDNEGASSMAEDILTGARKLIEATKLAHAGKVGT
jgi:acetoin utilization deacetylase AcuC-like enzyme